MAKELNVKCNFTTVFSQFNTIEDLKAVANNICAQVKTAYEARVDEIKSGKTDITVEVAAQASPTPKTKAKTKKKESAKTDSDTLIAITDKEAIKKLGLTFEKYSDRSWVLRGDTKPLRQILKEQFKGVFNSRLNGGEGWIFKTATAQSVSDALGLGIKTA